MRGGGLLISNGKVIIMKLFSVKMVTTIVFKNPKILSSKNLLFKEMTKMAFAVFHKDQPNDFF